MADLNIDAIRSIDNRGRSLPVATFILVAILIVVAVWFFRGGSFRLYASLFFGLYHLTKISWLSIMLVSLVQTIAFLPLRFLLHRFNPDIKDFEHELEKAKNDDQYIIFSEKVHKGDISVLFYILNFVLMTIAFVSAGRVFLLEFYNQPLDPAFLYDWIPYPEYPLQGTIFNFPWFRVTETISFGWRPVLIFWGIIIGIMAIARIGWRFVKFFLAKNQQVLKFRIAYNRLLLWISGFAGTLLIISTYLAFHFPVAFEPVMLTADISQQNTAFNIITAVATFLATIYMGFSHNKETAHEARIRGIPENIIQKVQRSANRISIRNASLVAVFAYAVTHMMPCSHDISVLSFETLIVISPFTFDIFLKKNLPSRQSAPAPASA